MLLKVEGTQKPYIIKDRGQIFVRIDGSTMPVSRTIIANLFVNMLERRNSIRKLQIHCGLLLNELILTAGIIDKVDRDYVGSFLC